MCRVPTGKKGSQEAFQGVKKCAWRVDTFIKGHLQIIRK